MLRAIQMTLAKCISLFIDSSSIIPIANFVQLWSRPHPANLFLIIKKCILSKAFFSLESLLAFPKSAAQKIPDARFTVSDGTAGRIVSRVTDAHPLLFTVSREIRCPRSIHTSLDASCVNMPSGDNITVTSDQVY